MELGFGVWGLSFAFGTQAQQPVSDAARVVVGVSAHCNGKHWDVEGLAKGHEEIENENGDLGEGWGLGFGVEGNAKKGVRTGVRVVNANSSLALMRSTFDSTSDL